MDTAVNLNSTKFTLLSQIKKGFDLPRYCIIAHVSIMEEVVSSLSVYRRLKIAVPGHSEVVLHVVGVVREWGCPQ